MPSGLTPASTNAIIVLSVGLSNPVSKIFEMACTTAGTDTRRGRMKERLDRTTSV